MRVRLSRAESVALAAERVLARSEEMPDGCRLWTGPVNHSGYPVIHMRQHSTTGAYRAVYEATHGPIPEGMQVEHACHSANVDTCRDGATCQHRRCVEITHLELLSVKENNGRSLKAQKTHCVNGHERTPENTYVRKDRGGVKQCRVCHSIQSRNAARAVAARARMNA